MALDNPRELRGLEIIGRGNQIKRVTPDMYRVNSQTNHGSYLVVRKGDDWSCECPDHKYRSAICKHIYAVHFSLNLRQRVAVQNLGMEDVAREGCRICGSSDVIKLGLRHNKRGDVQKFMCKECGHYYSDNEGFESAKVTPKAITIALDLFFKGVSLRKICDHLKQFEGIEVTHPAVLKWIRKYIELMKSYVDRFTPQVSGMWHSDEMMINVRKTKATNKGNYDWLWNLMDHETRFLLASQVTKQREVKDAKEVFHQAKEVANGQIPDFIVTDKLRSYDDAFNKEFFTLKNPRTKHAKLKNIKEGTNNNIVERLHGTKRERLKVMRGLDRDESAQKFVEADRLYYNFLRPHMTLNGKTPAEVANIKLQLEGNRWLSLIKQSAKFRNQTPNP